MKRVGIILWIFLFLLVVINGTGSAALVQGTKHDLSAPSAGGTGPGPIRSGPAGGTSEICVFCHTPHGAKAATAGAPLWNKNLTSDPIYTVYTSDVLTQLSYPGAEAPVLTGKAVHVINTRLCLSCHDGTIALGQLANLPYGFSSDIPMSNAGSPITNMPTAAVGYIGIDLRDDHPVAIPYTQASDQELANSPGGKAKLFPDLGSGNNYVECTSCHDPHDNTQGNFLVETNKNSALCLHCHSNKTGFTNSVHDDNTINVAYAPPMDTTPQTYHGPRVGDVKCMNCHFPHKAGIIDTSQLPRASSNLTANSKAGYYLLSFQEEMSCFNDSNRWNQQNITACHGTNSPTKNIESLVATGKYRAHWVGNYTGIHLATEAQQQLPPAAPWYGGGNANEHIECQDCHNPHTARGTLHAKGTNQVGVSSSPLYGTGGVTPTAYPAWAPLATGSYTPVQPTGVTSTTSPGVTKEYEICLKCHSDFAWNVATPPNSISLGAPMTNQAMEFGSSATSSHPVVSANSNSEGGPAYLNGWTNLSQTMYCSDCHGNDLGTPAGPHGSGQRSMLFKPYDPSTIGQSSGELCFDCHDFNTYNAGGVPITNTGFRSAGQNLHERHMSPAGVLYQGGVLKACTNCHTNPTHGSNKPHLISYSVLASSPDPAPYGSHSYLARYTLRAPGTYVNADCAALTCHGGTHPTP